MQPESITEVLNRRIFSPSPAGTVSQCQFRNFNAESTRVRKKSRSFARAQDDAGASFWIAT
jgi:hypothetical protein